MPLSIFAPFRRPRAPPKRCTRRPFRWPAAAASSCRSATRGYRTFAGRAVGCDAEKGLLGAGIPGHGQPTQIVRLDSLAPGVRPEDVRSRLEDANEQRAVPGLQTIE